MNKLERCDTEPLFPSQDLDINAFIREDSLLPNLGSHAFSDFMHLPSEENLDKQSPIGVMTNSDKKIESDFGLKASDSQWNTLDNGNGLVTCHQAIVQNVIKIEDLFPATSIIKDNLVSNYENIELVSTSPCDFQPSLSTQPWSGIHSFNIALDMAKNPSTKWGYSENTNKLYVMPQVVVPIEVSVKEWVDAYINITPVYKKSQFHPEAVNRCFNHKKADEEKFPGTAKHIIQAENEDAVYKCIGGRHCVEVPLGVPAPGESTKLLFIKCGCWNTCTGGPNRRQILIVFTLVSRSGQEIGRQVLEVKSCQCPIRDMGIENQKKKTSPKKTQKTKNISDDKIASGSNGCKKMKLEVTDVYEQIVVPSSIAPDVKRYINMLMAEKFVKQSAGHKLPFPQHS